MATKKQREEQQAAIADLLKILRPGDTIYTKLISVSRSGFRRVMDVYVIRDNEPILLTRSVAKATGNTYSTKQEGLVAIGCGMDMGFAVVYALGHYLWPQGTPTPHGIRNGEPDSDGGYALKHRWL